MTQQYKRLNNIIGWLVFVVAAFVYLSTIESTASFWDCGEFIATSFKLEVGHPPGAPLFMMVSRVATLLSFGNHALAARMVNSMSALASAFTILFLFWTITMIAKRMLAKNTEELSMSQSWVIMGTGIVGALAYTFSDTFWFSAVEGEVYASSSFFTAITFWAILKWEAECDQPGANRWLIMIGYLTGLAIGVHLLNLLTIPAIVFVFYYKKYPFTTKGFIISGFLALFLTGFILWGLIPGLLEMAFKFELLFTNGLGMPFNTGSIIYFILLFALIIFGLYFTHKKGKVVYNTIILFITVIIIGYSSFTTVVIRANANTPLDENNPDCVFNLESYLNRDQYGDTPLITGQYYNAPLDPQQPYIKDKVWYVQKNNRYEVADVMQKPNYDSRFCGFLPRMWSPEPHHVRAYKKWANITGTPIMVTKQDGKTETLYKPTFLENIKYLISYQFGHMYLRYFMWNFAGRQNDIQGHGELTNGNWICGIPFIDNMRLGDQTKVPKVLLNNKGRNKYYLLPLILGLIGLYYHYKKDRQYTWVVMLLFLITGLAIVFYLNQYPYQPRERDYAYAGSFYAYCIWIGIGVMAIYEFLKKKMNEKASAVVGTAVCMSVPCILGAQNWDDHDRSYRYTCRDFAKDYLNSCAPNAVLFTNGDNDTFPLWYCQEVEGIRTDVRVVNISLLNTDWYIDQMKRKAYDSDPVPFGLTRDKYVQGKRDIVYIIPDPRLKDRIDIKDVMDFVSSDDPSTKYATEGELLDYIPTKSLKSKIDSAQIYTSGVVPKGYESKVVKEMKWDLSGNHVVKNHLMVLDLLAHNDWKRPIYFAITVGSDNYFGMEKYFRQEGLAYRLVPYETKSFDGQEGEISTDIMYKNLMEKFAWGGINDSRTYLDEGIIRMSMNFRNIFVRLASGLIKENKKDSALKVLDRCEAVMPNKLVPYNYFNIQVAELYHDLGQVKKADTILKTVAAMNKESMAYYLSIPQNKLEDDINDLQRELGIANELVNVCNRVGQKAIAKDIVSSTIIQIETNYKLTYTQLANNQEQLSQWYQTLDDFSRNVLALYMQFKHSQEESTKLPI